MTQTGNQERHPPKKDVAEKAVRKKPFRGEDSANHSDPSCVNNHNLSCRVMQIEAELM